MSEASASKLAEAEYRYGCLRSLYCDETNCVDAQAEQDIDNMILDAGDKP